MAREGEAHRARQRLPRWAALLQCGLCDTYTSRTSRMRARSGRRHVPRRDARARRARPRPRPPTTRCASAWWTRWCTPSAAPPCRPCSGPASASPARCSAARWRASSASPASPDNDMEPRPILATTVEEILSNKGSSQPSPQTSASRRGGSPRRAQEALHRRRLPLSPPPRGRTPPRPRRAVRHGHQLHGQRQEGDPPKFLNAPSEDPCTVVHYEFILQDIRCTSSTRDGAGEKVPYFPSRPTSSRTSSRLVLQLLRLRQRAGGSRGEVHGRTYYHTDMTRHPRYVARCQERGKEMPHLIRDKVRSPPAARAKTQTLRDANGGVGRRGDARTRTGGGPRRSRWERRWRGREKVGPKGKRSSACTPSTTTPSATFCTSSDTSDRMRARSTRARVGSAAWWIEQNIDGSGGRAI